MIIYIDLQLLNNYIDNINYIDIEQECWFSIYNSH